MRPSVRAASGWPAVAGPLIAGLAARAGLIVWTHPLTLSLDEARFWDLAHRRMEGTAFLPPLYPLWLALLQWLTHDSVLAIRLVTAAMGLVSVVLVARLAETHAGTGSGTLATWAAALFPGLVYADGRLRSEPLLILLLLLFACIWNGIGTGPEGGRWTRILLAGLVSGGIVLVRPEFLLVPVLVLALGTRRAGAAAVLRRAPLLLAGLLLVVGPWMIRNQGTQGVWTITTNAGYNFWKSFNAASDGSQIPQADASLFDGVTEARFDAVGFRAGWSYIAAHPWRSLLLAPAKLGHLFGPERGLLSDLRQGQIPARSPAAVIVVACLQNACWFALFAAGLYALLGPGRSGPKDVALAVLGTLVLTHLVFFGDDRFHLPLAPFLCLVLPESWDGSLRARGAVALWRAAVALEGVAWIAILVRDAPRLAELLGGRP